MHIDDLIRELNQIKYEHGNVDVKIYKENHDGYGGYSFQAVDCVYSTENNIVEVW